jgi:hypothetical protein
MLRQVQTDAIWDENKDVADSRLAHLDENLDCNQKAGNLTE